MSITIDLSGQTILVTGASSGIGREIALTLGRAGAKIAVHAHRQVDRGRETAAACGHGSRFFVADLADEDQCRKLWEEAVAAFGRIDGLVNNAGVFLSAPPRQALDRWMDSWRRTLGVNLTAAGLLSRLALDHFQDNTGGRLIFIASRAAFRGETEDYLAYAASKGGVVALSRSIARSFGKSNIKSFVIAPGFVRTPMAEPYIREAGEEAITAEIALPKLTEPADVAPMVLFLCSGALDHYTGSTFDVNAGSYMH